MLEYAPRGRNPPRNRKMPARTGDGEQTQRGVPEQAQKHRGNGSETTGGQERASESRQANYGDVQENLDGEAEAGAAGR